MSEVIIHDVADVDLMTNLLETTHYQDENGNLIDDDGALVDELDDEQGEPDV